MRTLNNYSHHTEFSVTGYNCSDLPMGARACFGTFVRQYDRKIPLHAKVTVRLYCLNGNRSGAGDTNNNLITDYAGIERQLKRMREFYYFTYTIKPYGGNYFEVEITGNMYAFQWKLILTLLRHLYEYPYNVVHLILDKWMQEGKLQDLSYVSAFNLLSQTMAPAIICGTEDGLTYYHWFSIPISNETLKQRILRCISRDMLDQLNGLFEFVQDEGTVIAPDYNYNCYNTTTTALLTTGLDNWKYVMQEVYGLVYDKYPKPFQALIALHPRRINYWDFNVNTKFKRLQRINSSKFAVETWLNPAMQNDLYNMVLHNLELLNSHIKENE